MVRIGALGISIHRWPMGLSFAFSLSLSLAGHASGPSKRYALQVGRLLFELVSCCCLAYRPLSKWARKSFNSHASPSQWFKFNQLGRAIAHRAKWHAAPELMARALEWAPDKGRTRSRPVITVEHERLLAISIDSISSSAPI